MSTTNYRYDNITSISNTSQEMGQVEIFQINKLNERASNERSPSFFRLILILKRYSKICDTPEIITKLFSFNISARVYATTCRLSSFKMQERNIASREISFCKEREFVKRQKRMYLPIFSNFIQRVSFFYQESINLKCFIFTHEFFYNVRTSFYDKKSTDLSHRVSDILVPTPCEHYRVQKIF